VLEQVSHTLFQTRFPTSQEAVAQALGAVGRWEGELEHARADGNIVLVESRQIVVRDQQGQPSAILEINRDITARRRGEEAHAQVHAAILAQRNFLQELLDAIPSSVCVVHGEDARLVVANRFATQIWGAEWPTGQPMEAFLASHGIRLLDAHGQALPPGSWGSLRALRQREAVRSHEEVIERPGRDRFPILVNAVPLSSADWLSLDLPEGGAVRAALPGSRSADPRAAEEDEPLALVMHQDVTPLKEADRLKDEFIALAAHELRNPIAAILGFAQLIQPRTADPSAVDPPSAGSAASADDEREAWQREALGQVLEGTRRLVALTDDLLDATRLQAGRLELHREPSDLVALARRVLRRHQGATSHHTLGLETDRDYVVADVDVGRIEQVLTNLLSNSIKYSPEGGPISVTITEEAEARRARLEVRDRGMGIPAAEQARIFERFMRAGNARTRQIQGTGLGLFLCRELVEHHGGQIGFESVEGEGSAFFFTVPLAAVDEPAAD
jgi:signal transduction histidine kinase